MLEGAEGPLVTEGGSLRLLRRRLSDVVFRRLRADERPGSVAAACPVMLAA